MASDEQPDSPAMTQLLELLRKPTRTDESQFDAWERRERELKILFAALTPVDALAIRKRLASSKADELATVWKERLGVDRRDRLVAFLADPRRPFYKG
jgi:hypothetical protein